MAKQKKKKRRSTLSAQEQDFVDLLKMNSNPDTLGREVIQMKTSARDFLATLEMETPFDPPAQTARARLFLDKLFKDDTEATYISTMRTIIQGYWMSHRVTVEVTPELVEFVNSDYWLFKSKINAGKFICAACQNPILLDFSSLGIKETILCGMTSILAPGEDGEDRSFPSYLNQIYIRFSDQVNVCSTSLPATSTDLTLESYAKAGNDSINVNGIPTLRLLIYIGYLFDLEDDGGRYLIQDKVKPTHYRAMPMPTRYDDPIPGSAPEWANSGLRIAYGYLDRANMLRDVRQQRDETGFDPSEEIIEFSDPVETAIFSQALLDWETSRIIYLVDDKSSAALVEKYGDNLGSDDFVAGLEAYMPAKSFVVSSNGMTSFFVTTCKIKGETTRRIFVHNLFEPDGMYLCGKNSVVNAPRAIDSTMMRTALCAVKHILTTFQQREEKKLSAAPATAKAFSAVLPPKKEDGPPKPAMYEGSSIDLSGSAPRIFEVTGRTVKKLSNKELVQRHGWTMTPHTRRSHAHRYWVGKGEARRLEVRWLQDIKINACMEDGGTVSTVVRKIE